MRVTEIPKEVVAALLALFGVAILAAVQWIVARSTIRAEAERLHRQLSSEFRLEQFSAWQERFQSVMAELLAVTDPQTARPFRKDVIVPLVLKAQLMLNLRVPQHAEVNGLVNRIGLATTGWDDSHDADSLLSIHAALLEAARAALYLPGK